MLCLRSKSRRRTTLGTYDVEKGLTKSFIDECPIRVTNLQAERLLTAVKDPNNEVLVSTSASKTEFERPGWFTSIGGNMYRLTPEGKLLAQILILWLTVTLKTNKDIESLRRDYLSQEDL